MLIDKYHFRDPNYLMFNEHIDEFSKYERYE